MRSLVLIFATFALLMIGFLIYNFTQPKLAPLNNEPYEAAIATRPVATDNRMGIGPGEGVWIERHDPNTGRLTERFRGNHYDWNPDNSMKVESPQAEFFLDRGRILRVNGNHGNVVVEEGGPPGKNSVAMNQPGAPTRGNMKDVTIRLFESESTPNPTLTVTMDNATFDTQINRIYTDAATINGKKIPADQIPVHMRGEDEDFDGQGMQIRWGQQQRTLQLLQIDHGQQLIIKHPNSADRQMHTQSKPAATTPPPSPNTDNTSTENGAPTPAQASPPPAIQIYRATFERNVHITQAGTELARADQMLVDFASEQNDQSSESPSSSAAPSSAPTSAERPTSHQETHQSNNRPATQSTNPLGNEPIRVTWDGKLIVVPVTETGPIQADAHGQVITFLSQSQPVVVRQKGTEVHATRLVYGGSQEELYGEGTAQTPVIMTSSDGGKVRTQTIDYFRRDAHAILTGTGEVSRPLKSNNGATSQMNAQWTQKCDLTFFGSDEHDLSIHTADIDGNVKIDHPQVKLDADHLSLAFVAPTTPGQQPDLSHMHSTGSVNAVVRDAHGKSQAIQCQTLDLTTASLAGSPLRRQASRYINRLIADGQVRAYDPDSEIRAGHLDATLIPATENTQTASNTDQPLAAAQLDRLIATNDVHVHGKDGAAANSDKLDVKMSAGQASSVVLTGSPAKVQKGQDITIGNLIKLNPQTQQYQVPGEGSLHLARQTDNNSPPTDVAWTGGLNADLNKNAIEIDRDVTVKTTSTDQTHNKATSDHLHVTLADKPPQPQSAKTSRQQATPHSDALFGNAGDVDVTGQKEARSLTMTGNVRVQSIRGDDAGHLLMQFNLISTRLDYDIPGQKMTVPQPGQIFLYDNRKAAPSAPEPAQAPKQSENASPLSAGNSRGMTAVKFEGDLVYDQNNARIQLDKNVFLRHEPLDQRQAPMEMRAQHMRVDLLKTGEKSAAADQMSISHLLATDQVMFTTKTMQCQADSVDYTPATGMVIISGSQYVPAIMYDPSGISTGTFQKLYYNSKSEQIERTDGFIANERRGK